MVLAQRLAQGVGLGLQASEGLSEAGLGLP